MTVEVLTSGGELLGWMQLEELPRPGEKVWFVLEHALPIVEWLEREVQPREVQPFAGAAGVGIPEWQKRLLNRIAAHAEEHARRGSQPENHELIPLHVGLWGNGGAQPRLVLEAVDVTTAQLLRCKQFRPYAP